MEAPGQFSLPPSGLRLLSMRDSLHTWVGAMPCS